MINSLRRLSRSNVEINKIMKRPRDWFSSGALAWHEQRYTFHPQRFKKKKKVSTEDEKGGRKRSCHPTPGRDLIITIENGI